MMRIRLIVFGALLALLVGGTAWTAEIHEAALNGDLAKVKELIQKDPSLLTSKGRNDKVPLHWAAQGGHLEIVKLLVEKGAPVNVMNIANETPLHYAAGGGYKEVVIYLISKGADLNALNVQSQTPVSYAARSDRTDLVKLFVEKGADVMVKDKHGATLLFSAAGGDSVEMVQFLIGKGLKADAVTEEGDTPLHYACWNGNAGVIKVLIQNGADPNVVSRQGLWPICLAAEQGGKDVVAVLLASGAKVDVRTKAGSFTPLHIACIKGYGDIANHLIAKGADVNAKDAYGKRPLSYACCYGHGKIAESLKQKGAADDGAKLSSGPPAQLTEPLKDGAAVVCHLGHSGWAVRTKSHFLVFDYAKFGATPDEPSILNGCFCLDELGDQNITVFSSHAHGDHYMPVIFEWKQKAPDITYVMGFDPEKQTGYTMIPPGQTQTVNGMEITTIESNDSGEGFLVKVDGVTVFHPGDHANRNQDFSGPFKKEIDTLADKGVKVDILFTPVSGCGFPDHVAVRKGAFYTIDRLSARIVFPMHGDGEDFRAFADSAKGAGYEVPICCAKNAGDWFVVTSEGVKVEAHGAIVCGQKGGLTTCSLSGS